MIVSPRLIATTKTVGNWHGVAPHTVVALPPSDADPVWDEMRIAIAGVIISRAFDPGDAIVTGYPWEFMTEGGDSLLTEAGETLTTETAS